MRVNPRNGRIDDIVTVCNGFGIACTAPRKGSHYKVKHVDMAEILTAPAQRPIKPVHGHELVGFIDVLRGARRLNPFDYEVDILPLSETDGGGFTAIVPELPGCRSDGDTPQEALDNIYDAIGCWIEAAQEMGRAVPQPRRAAA